jgi:hypothetical protein
MGEPGVAGPAASGPVPNLRAVDEPVNEPADDAPSPAAESPIPEAGVAEAGVAEPGVAEPGVAEPGGSPLAGRHGLALAYAVLDRLVDEHGLGRATVVVDDVDLGCQLLFDRHRPLGEADIARSDALVARAAAGLHTVPPLEPDTVDRDLLVALVATALRVAALDGSVATGDAADLLEIGVRRVAGVHTVVVDTDSGVVQVLATTDAPADLARQVVDLATSFLDGAVAVEIIRGAGHGASTGGNDLVIPFERTELVAVTNAFETQEIEVHLRRDGVRTIGRAPAARGLTGAVEATLAALAEMSDVPERELDWVRTIETTSQRRFLVAVALRDPAGATSYGLADEGTPIAAAAHATLNAIGR